MYVVLLDRVDRLGTHLVWYISTFLMAIKNKYKIFFYKPHHQYNYYHTIFGTILFNMMISYNSSFKTHFQIVEEEHHFFKKNIHNIIQIQSDYITAFHDIFKPWKSPFDEVAKKYDIPYDPDKTIVVHLRLDDKQDCFVDDESRKLCSQRFQHAIDHDILWDGSGYQGQSAMKEDHVQKIIDKALQVYEGYEVIIITNGKHTLPYPTLCNTEEHDLYLLCRAKVLIGSMSTFSFAAMMFGDPEKVYYPLWDHAVCFGLTTKYDKTKNIELF